MPFVRGTRYPVLFNGGRLAFNPQSLYANGEQGAWYDPSDLSTLFQDSAGTTPVTTAGDPVGLMLDKSGRGNHASQSTAMARPLYGVTPSRVYLDKADDALVVTIPTGGWTGTLVLSTVEGTASYGFSASAGSFTIGGVYFPTAAGSSGGIVGYLVRDGALTDQEEDQVEALFADNGGGAAGALAYGAVTDFSNWWRSASWMTEMPLIDTSSGTDFNGAWRGCSSLASFPLIDTSSGASFIGAWRDCSSLASFPLIDTSSGASFTSAWSGCASLASFPNNFFDGSVAVAFANAFVGTALNQTSIDGILVSINSNGTSNGTFNQSGGSAPSATGEAAITAMRSRGWTVTVTGGF